MLWSDGFQLRHSYVPFSACDTAFQRATMGCSDGERRGKHTIARPQAGHGALLRHAAVIKVQHHALEPTADAAGRWSSAARIARAHSAANGHTGVIHGYDADHEGNHDGATNEGGCWH